LAGSNESRQHLATAMKEGYVKVQQGKGIIYGGAGTGKSSFIDLIVGNAPRTIRVSTPLAVRPVQMQHLNLGEKKWEKLSIKQQKEILVKAIVNIKSKEEEEESYSEDSDEEIVAEKSSFTQSSEVASTGSLLSPNDPPMASTAAYHPPDPPTAVEASIQDTTTTSRSPATVKPTSVEDMVVLIDRWSRTGETITIYCKIYLIDSGGQPQFHEILPAFMR